MARTRTPDYARLDDVDIYVQSSPMSDEEQERLSHFLKEYRKKHPIRNPFKSSSKVKGTHTPKNPPYQEHLAKKLQSSEFAAHYLATYLEDGTPEEIAAAISKILRARKKSELPKIYQSLFESNRDVIPLGRAA